MKEIREKSVVLLAKYLDSKGDEKAQELAEKVSFVLCVCGGFFVRFFFFFELSFSRKVLNF